MADRIDAPVKVMETLKRVQDAISRMQAEVEAMLFGAKEALNVPDSWQWDGNGWIAPSVENQAE